MRISTLLYGLGILALDLALVAAGVWALRGHPGKEQPKTYRVVCPGKIIGHLDRVDVHYGYIEAQRSGETMLFLEPCIAEAE